MFYIGLYSKNIKKIFLSETIWPRVLIFGKASSGGPQPSLFKLCPWDQKWPRPRGLMLDFGLHS